MTIDYESIDYEIEAALKADEEAHKPKLTAWQRLTDYYFYRFDRRLNDPVWLIDKLTTQHQSEAGIARLIGCSEQLVHKKANKVFEMPDWVFSTYTGFFHSTKWLIYPLIRAPLRKIQQGIDSVYDKTKSRNAGIFKDIIHELESLDDDQGDGNFIMHHDKLLGMSRKAMYLLILKFAVCLYEYDNHYAERGDYIIRRILERQTEIYLDDQASPANWYPHRNLKTVTKYMVSRGGEKL